MRRLQDSRGFLNNSAVSSLCTVLDDLAFAALALLIEHFDPFL